MTKATRVEIQKVRNGDMIMVSHENYQGSGVVLKVVKQDNGYAMLLKPTTPQMAMTMVTMVFPADAKVSVFEQGETV